MITEDGSEVLGLVHLAFHLVGHLLLELPCFFGVEWKPWAHSSAIIRGGTDGFADFFAGSIEAIVGPAEERGELVILHLSGVIEGVVVTLGTADLLTEEDLHGVADVIKKHATISEVVSGGGVFSNVAFGCEHGVDHLVIGHVVFNGIAKPDVPAQSRCFFVGFDTEEVTPEIEDPGLQSGGCDQAVDQLTALGFFF